MTMSYIKRERKRRKGKKEISFPSKEVHELKETGKYEPIVKAFYRQNEIDHHSIPYQGINHYKSDIPPKFMNVDFSFHTNHNQHRAPGKSLNNQGNSLP